MALFNKMLAEKGVSNLVGISAGLAADGSEISDNSAKALAKMGIELNNFRSKQLTEQMIKDAHLIVVMTKGHKDLLMRFVEDDSKICVLGNGIPDPYGREFSVYESCLEQIKNGLDKLFEKGVFGDI